MPDPEQLWDRLCTGRWVLTWTAALLTATPERVARLAQAAATLPTTGGRQRAMQVLFRLTSRPEGRRQLGHQDTPRYLCAALWPAPTRGGSFLDEAARDDILCLAQQVIRRCGAPAYPALRAMLAAPQPRGVGYRAFSEQRQHGKLAGLHLLEPDMGADDRELLYRLWSSREEPRLVREWAVRAYLHWGDGAQAAEAVGYLLANREQSIDWLREETPEPTRAAMVPALIAELDSRDNARAGRAVALLVQVGRPAVRPLVELMRHSTSPAARRCAAWALAELDPAALASTQAQAKVDDRALSQYTAELPEPRRGLSPTDSDPAADDGPRGRE
ncbi:MAG: hypothetical protein HZB16_15095 [Armatimonadetes bacterium]|nr:hypothetical protein [Armatimonadota bacterium]